MTAVAQPLTSFQSSRWTSNGGGGSGDFAAAANPDDAGRMFAPGPRKTAQRQNSSSSIASTASASSTSTVLAPTTHLNGGAVQPPTGEIGSWAARKKPTRGLWPPGKAEPATGLSTARPQTINAAAQGPTASSAISALSHAPLLPSQQMANGTAQTNGVLRDRAATMPPAILQLLPMNSTFERKIITVPYQPDVLRIGRQTNQKTVPTPHNGYFDSKVLSRQHAEVYADLNGRIFIRDVKSSNGTFVNGMRLSQENKESEPRELRDQDVLELGIDIVSEDQKTVVHHKVAAKVEHAGIYQPGNDPLNFGDLDPSAGPAPLVGAPQLRRSGSAGSITNGRLNAPHAAGPNGAAALGMAGLPPSQLPKWLNPITTEHLVRKLNLEQRFVEAQSAELRKARELIEKILGGGGKAEPSTKESKSAGSEKMKFSPTKGKLDLKNQFSEPPAPPPQAPLPEKPDVARALADPIILPLLRRADTTRAPNSNSPSSSPTRAAGDHSSDILRLCEELKLAKGELTSQSARLKSLEGELVAERVARESAEERAQRLLVERGSGSSGSSSSDGRRDSPTNEGHPSAGSSPSSSLSSSTASTTEQQTSDLQIQLDRLRATMDEMKQQMEAYRLRAEVAERARDEARLSLAEMVEVKRRENDADAGEETSRNEKSGSSLSSSSDGKSPSRNAGKRGMNGGLIGAGESFPSTNAGAAGANGHLVAAAPVHSPSSSSSAEDSASPSTTALLLLRRAGLTFPTTDDNTRLLPDQPISAEQARVLVEILRREVLQQQQQQPKVVGEDGSVEGSVGQQQQQQHLHAALRYYGLPYGSFAAVVLVGVVAMGWVNGWVKAGER